MNWNDIFTKSQNYNPSINYDDIYWSTHPRYCFFSSLPNNATLLDLGAGDGSIVWWKKKANRPDIKLYAIDMKMGKYFDQYNGYQLYNLDYEKCVKHISETITAVYSSHVIEHLNEQTIILQEINRILSPNGLFYMEIPTTDSMNNPRKQDLMKLAPFKKYFTGFDQRTLLSFYDDESHKKTFAYWEALKWLGENGFSVVTSGFVTNDFLEDKLIQHGIKNNNVGLILNGLWLKFNFSQYFVVRKK